MQTVEVITNTLDFASFVLAAPELVGTERLQGLAGAVNWLVKPRSFFGYGKQWFQKTNPSTKLGLSLAFVVCLWELQDLYFHFDETGLPFWVFSIGLGLIAFGLIMNLWVFIASRNTFPRSLLLMAALLFAISRTVAIVHGFSDSN